jgi:hypothetical protein
MMAELPRPADFSADIPSVIERIRSTVKEFFDMRWERSSHFQKELGKTFSRDLLGWLCLGLIVPGLIYATAELAVMGMEMASEPIHSRLEANYGEWTPVEIRRVKSAILEEILKDRPKSGMDSDPHVENSAFVGLLEIPGMEGRGSQSGIPIPATPTPSGESYHPTTTPRDGDETDLATPQSPATVGPTTTPTATDTTAPTLTPNPTHTPVPPSPAPTEPSMVTICHKPGEREKTLQVPSEDVPAHQGHGDYLGACSGS